jgi:1-acyl-sn-glycerol-3-phosphate acyltransferase
LTAPFDQNRRLVHRFACLWGYHYFLINPFWKCTFEGVENIRRDQTYVLVANHQSMWDIMLLYGLFRHFKWVSKQDVLKIPFIGWNMVINQYVTVAREDLSSIKEMMKACRKWLSKGSSIMIFPEGTRSENGEMGAFKDGPFRLAIESGVPVVPIVLDGTFHIFPKGAKRIRFNTHVRVKVLAPIATASYAGRTRELREQVRQSMLQTLASFRNLETTNEQVESEAAGKEDSGTNGTRQCDVLVAR